MSFYPEVPMSLQSIWRASTRHYFYIFKLTFVYIALIVLAKNSYLFIGGMPHNWIFKAIAALLLTAGLIYLWSCSFASACAALRDEFFNMRIIFRRINRMAIQIYMCCLLYAVVVVALYYLGHGIIYAIEWGAGKQAWLKGLGIVVFCGFPIMIFLAMTFFALPLVIAEEEHYFKAFYQSVYLVSTHWAHGFVAYIVLLVMLFLTSPDTLHWHFMSAYFITLPFDLVVLSVLLPLYNTVVLLSLNDLQLRMDPDSDL